LRQQFAIDLLDQADAEPAGEPVKEDGDDAGSEGDDDAGSAPEDDADTSADGSEPAAFAEPNDVTARVVVAGVAPWDAAGGPHLEI